jgi:hypothetical protein
MIHVKNVEDISRRIQSETDIYVGPNFVAVLGN